MGQRALACAQKKARAEGWKIFWVDESGFYLLPAAVRTWAPRGQTPQLRVKLTREHLSAISAISRRGGLHFRLQGRAFKGRDVARFLRQLLAQENSKLLIIWDGAPIHRAKAVKELCQSFASRLWLEPLPGYAPELNPDEGIWRYLKRVELRNCCADDQEQLQHQLQLAVRRLRRKDRVLRACFKEVGFIL